MQVITLDDEVMNSTGLSKDRREFLLFFDLPGRGLFYPAMEDHFCALVCDAFQVKLCVWGLFPGFIYRENAGAVALSYCCSGGVSAVERSKAV